MDLVSEVKQRMAGKKKRIVLPEGEDPRVLQAASFLAEEQISSVILVGDKDRVTGYARKLNIDLTASINFLTFRNFENKSMLIDDYYQRQKHKGCTIEEAESVLQNPFFFGASLVANGFADGCVAGSVATTGDVIRAALKCIGLREGSSLISSIFLMVMPDGKVMTYGDCGVVPYPDSKQLADIAIDSARTHRLLTRQEPIVALLSFSTKGSALHERTRLVTDALELAKKKAPGLNIDGELQFDAAFVPEIARCKAPDSKVAGRANVFIFPNLDAGNIAYKITERLAGAVATGPILQGLAKPVMDLSRGCSWQDIVNAACVALLMGEEPR